MNSGWWMTASRRQMPRSRKIIRWKLLGLRDPAVTSIEDVRRQVISAASVGLSSETVARTQRLGITPQSISKKTVSTQIQREGISISRAKSLVPKGT
jgi:hypothetical protein